MRLLMLLAVVLLVSATSDPAADQVIHQHGRAFSETVVQLSRGEPITFLNDDTVPHDVMSNSPDNKFDLGSQMPGMARTVRFDAAGIVAVICAIHPRMRMSIVGDVCNSRLLSHPSRANGGYAGEGSRHGPQGLVLVAALDPRAAAPEPGHDQCHPSIRHRPHVADHGRDRRRSHRIPARAPARRCPAGRCAIHAEGRTGRRDTSQRRRPRLAHDKEW